ncbi:cyclophilin-like fold protein [Thomasclavelia spiroformis]|uniref:cyclophilin-like fold protein n=1 Tax=Thomasclavelia spiroformis TaxID=29348 RepID=UPI00241DAB60|nr:cyclophilin-like fold protein [Thomasclavelia spiroformis]MBS6115557.1 hypothetical protein [Thomasclavelia spiroformis]
MKIKSKKMIGILVIFIILLGTLFVYFMNNNQNAVKESKTKTSDDKNTITNQTTNTMIIKIMDNSYSVVFELNDSDGAKSLYEQLPLKIEVEDYSTNEKIFYPPNELDVTNTPLASNGENGVLAYYEPWGDVVMFYDSFDLANDLYQLGNAIEGIENIENLSGEITIEKVEN